MTDRSESSGPTWFVFNLDAELEWSQGDAYRSSTRILAQIDREAEFLCTEMARHGISVRPITELPPSRDPRQTASIHPDSAVDCWSPTPRARAELLRRGLPAPDAPGPEVLRQVNHRAFAYPFSPPLPGAEFVTTEADAWRVLEASPQTSWLLKRPFGFSGRMRKVLRPDTATAADRRWIAESMLGYGIGLAIEPLVDRVADFSLHGWLDPDGALRGGRAVSLAADDSGRGKWAGHRLATDPELTTAERAQLERSLENTAASLHRAGYFGPFGIDAFRWRDERDRIQFHPLVEVNARYTMAWWCGMGSVHR